jgi:cytoskeletal protein CcmA (bactofilin family)
MSDPKSVVPAAADRKTLVEEGTQFKGSLASNCPVVVRGLVEGDVAAPSLTVSSSGAVHGKVKVDELRSQGELAGEFDADIVQLSGVVKDSTVVRAKSLEVKLTPANGKMQVVFGDCTLDVGDMNAKPVEASKDDGVKGAEGGKDGPGTGKGGKGSKVPPPPEGAARRSVPPPGDNGAE